MKHGANDSLFSIGGFESPSLRDTFNNNMSMNDESDMMLNNYDEEETGFGNTFRKTKFR